VGKRNGRPIHGWLVIDKPGGLTSAAVIAVVRRLTGAAKAGHGGTLDPLATGVLPVALGEATKTVAYAMGGSKTYVFTIRWGEKRNTDDCDGETTAVSEVRPEAAAIADVLPRFTGVIEQVPPDFSAVKVGGRRAYALARGEQAVARQLQPREGFVEDIALLGRPDADHATFRVRSGKGVYMRSLARDIAAALGTYGHVSALRRLCVGPFAEAQALSLDRARQLDAEAILAQHLLPIGAALAGVPAVSVTEIEARRLQHGQPIASLPVASRSHTDGLCRDAVVYATAAGRPVALAQIKGSEIRPLRVLNV
jgi:tRNA pseudouridine55 synthase